MGETGKQWRSEDVLENRPPNISHLDDLMEEFLKLLLSKRRTRQLSSDSSLDTSPEPKKPRECDNPNFSEGECDEEGDDIILFALNMTEALQKPLQDILKKLEKLDAIEQAVNNSREIIREVRRKNTYTRRRVCLYQARC